MVDRKKSEDPLFALFERWQEARWSHYLSDVTRRHRRSLLISGFVVYALTLSDRVRPTGFPALGIDLRGLSADAFLLGGMAVTAYLLVEFLRAVHADRIAWSIARSMAAMTFAEKALEEHRVLTLQIEQAKRPVDEGDRARHDEVVFSWLSRARLIRELVVRVIVDDRRIAALMGSSWRSAYTWRELLVARSRLLLETFLDVYFAPYVGVTALVVGGLRSKFPDLMWC